MPRGNPIAMLDGISVANLARDYGTPLYILDEATLLQMIAQYRTAFLAYPAPVTILFAAKANLTMGLCQVLDQAGLSLDVVSGGEYYTAWKAGFPTDRILFNGNNKTPDELELALTKGIDRISVDNAHELSQIATLARRLGKQVSILLRVTPGIECHTHDYIKTGHLDSKFGFDLSRLPAIIPMILQDYADVVTLTGLHAHIGSQIFETRPYHDLVEVMLTLYADIRHQYGVTLTDLNMGGGLGMTYQTGDDPPEVADYASTIVDALTRMAHKLDFPLPHLFLEPGRSLIATAGVTLYTIGSMKTIPEIGKTYVAVDGGMGDNIRPALYGAKYSAVVATRVHQPHTHPVSIVGKYCESGDVLLKDFSAPETLEPGDLLLVFGTGAYNYSMASNYNRVPRPAMIMVSRGHARLLVRRETWDDVIRCDVVEQDVQSR
jgi:diaminopimelate decarboxylase